MFLQIFLSLTVLFLVFIVKWKTRKFRKLARELSRASFREWPILGHALSFLGDSEDLMRSFEELGRDCIANGALSVWFVNKLVVVLADPYDVEVVMKFCLEKDDLNHVTRELIGSGSIMAPVPIWRPRRKVIAQTFAPKTLNSFVQIFAKQSHIMLVKLKDHVGNRNVSIFEKATKYSLDSICETALGAELNSQSQSQNPILQSLNLFSKLVVLRAARPWLHPDFVYKWTSDYPAFKKAADIMKDFIRKIVKSKKENLSNNNKVINSKPKKVKSFLDHLCDTDNTKVFTDLELQEETLVLVFAGTDTSAVGVSFTSLLMAKHPEVQEKVFQEVMEVTGGRPIQAEDLPKLKYLEAVVKESLRLYPPVPLSIKHTSTDFELPSGVTLMPGPAIVVHTWALHRNPKYWGPGAEVFRPERFLDKPSPHPYAFIPFGKGPRMCLGAEYAMMSMKTVLASLVRRYRLVPPADGFGLQEHLQTKFQIMLKHVGDFELRLELRP